MTKTDDRLNSYAMNAEDQYRIARLYEETRSRLEEIALIGSRVTGAALNGEIVRKFAPVAETHGGPDVDAEIICGPSGTAAASTGARTPEEVAVSLRLGRPQSPSEVTVARVTHDGWDRRNSPSGRRTGFAAKSRCT